MWSSHPSSAGLPTQLPRGGPGGGGGGGSSGGFCGTRRPAVVRLIAVLIAAAALVLLYGHVAGGAGAGGMGVLFSSRSSGSDSTGSSVSRSGSRTGTGAGSSGDRGGGRGARRGDIGTAVAACAVGIGEARQFDLGVESVLATLFVPAGLPEDIVESEAARVRACSSLYKDHLCSEGSSKGGGQACHGLVLDVGAFVGTHTVALASLGFNVHTFDVAPPSLGLVKCAAAANQLLPHVTVNGYGLSDVSEGACAIFPMATLGHRTMVSPKSLQLAGGCTGGTAEVQLSTLDDYWETWLNKAHVHFIKLDAEGHEELILKGGTRMFAAAPPPFVMLRFSHQALLAKNSTASSMLATVESLGYRAYNCQMMSELESGIFGVQQLAGYLARGFSHLDLLLLHKSRFGANNAEKPLPPFVCA